ncbi:MAG: methyltransferase, partial [Propionibacteriaceae bacterium]|nr:methyltransferase [Propionibacteriaceae bacterium]
MQHADTADRLRAVLADTDYTVDAVLARIGDRGQRALGRNSTIAAEWALGRDADPLATLIRLWLLQRPVARRAVEQALPGLVDPLVAARILEADTDTVWAAVDVRPYAADDGTAGWVVSDLVNGLDAEPLPPTSDYVLGISPASTSLAQLTMRDPIASALDLGAGCGVQSLHLTRHTNRVVATDLNPRANELAAWTYRLSDVRIDQRLGSLYEPVADERFDLIVTNPPYVMSPPGPERLVYREGSLESDGLVETIVRRSVDHLTPGGSLQVLGNWAILDPDRWTERLADWIPAGCDALVMERERLDPFEYIEIWLADAGLIGHPDHGRRYREWLDYFDDLGITGVGMGWLMVHRSGSATPDIRIEQWPHAVEQPVGPAFSAHRDAVAYAQRSDDEILATNWRLADDIITETIGDPGAPDPRHIVFRSQRGFRRAVEVDTALGGVLGACDGDLPLGAIMSAVAGLLEVDPDEVRRSLLPRIRELL